MAWNEDNAEEHELTVAGIIIAMTEERSCGTGNGRMEHAQGRDYGMVQSTRAVVWLRVWADRNTSQLVPSLWDLSSQSEAHWRRERRGGREGGYGVHDMCSM